MFVQGYDARGIAEIFLEFGRQYRLTCDRRGWTGDVGVIGETPKDFSAEWDVTTKGDGWQVETRYRLLRWNDLVQADFMRPAWWKIVQMYRTVGIAMLNGAFMRMLRMNWRFALVTVTPIALITIWVLLGSFIGILCMNLVTALRAPELVAKFVGIVTGFGGFGSLLWLTEPVTGLLKRCDQAASIDEFINGKRKDWSQRLDLFAADLANTVRDSDADEVLIIGHGFGAALAINLVGRSLSRDAALGRHGPRVALLTLAASFPAVGFNPEARGFRNRLRQLAEVPDLDWVDVQSRNDILSFAPFDPIAGHDIVLKSGRRNPRIIEIRLRPWPIGTAHAQYLMANKRSGGTYDYYLICCGPSDLVTRLTRPPDANAAMAAKSGQS
ncbi:MAG: hypothetical protein ACREB2_10530 [Pseudolabrys sp.]